MRHSLPSGARKKQKALIARLNDNLRARMVDNPNIANSRTTLASYAYASRAASPSALMPRVVDTSVALKWVVREDFTDNALALRDDSLRRNDPIYVPPLLLYEATNVLYDFARHRKLTDQQAEQAVADIAAVVTIVPFDLTQLVRAMHIANQANKQDTYDS